MINTERKMIKIAMHSVPKSIACSKSLVRNIFGINDFFCARRSKFFIFVTFHEYVELNYEPIISQMLFHKIIL